MAARFGFTYPLGAGWPDEVLAWLGIALAAGGALLVGTARAPRTLWESLPGARLTGVWVMGCGFAFILGSVGLAAACVAAVGVALVRMLWFGPCESLVEPPEPAAKPSPEPGSHAERALDLVVSRAPIVCGITALALLLEVWEDVVSPGGPKVHALELGGYGMLVALLGLAWTALRSGGAALKDPPAAADAAAPSPARPLAAAGLLFAGFAILAVVIQAPSVRALDMQVVHVSYRSGGPEVTNLMDLISRLGGAHLLVYWIPLLAIGLALARRGRSLPFFAAGMLGVPGLEAFFKGLIHRLRPGGLHFDSYPSGHTLAATVLAGTLLLILLPACRTRRQRAALWTAAAAWSILMGASRIYLGRHFPTDVLAGLLLGSAWVCLCLGAVRWGAEVAS